MVSVPAVMMYDGAVFLSATMNLMPTQARITTASTALIVTAKAEFLVIPESDRLISRKRKH
jgi:hypothetical protein